MTKIPPEFDQKVDLKRVNEGVINNWVTSKINELLGTDDDVTSRYVIELLNNDQFPKIKEILKHLEPMLEKNAMKFCKELWNLCLSAQKNPQGVPKELLEQRKLELKEQKEQSEKAAKEAQARRDAELEHDDHVDNLRRRDRQDRAMARGARGRGRGGDYRSSDAGAGLEAARVIAVVPSPVRRRHHPGGAGLDHCRVLAAVPRRHRRDAAPTTHLNAHHLAPDPHREDIVGPGLIGVRQVSPGLRHASIRGPGRQLVPELQWVHDRLDTVGTDRPAIGLLAQLPLVPEV